MSLNASILMLAASVFWGPVAPGPHPVGMRLVRVETPAGSRPIELLHFFPAARATDRRWTLRDLVRVSCRETGRRTPIADDAGCETSFVKQLAEYRPERAGVDVFSAELASSRDAASLSEPRPVVIFDGGLTSDALPYFPLAEFLASHGIHAICLPSIDPAGAALTFDAAGLRRKTENLRRALEAVRAWPAIDRARVGVAAWSVGGVTTAALASSDSGIRAVLSLDGGLGYDYGAPLFSAIAPGALRQPYLHITGGAANPFPVPKDLRLETGPSGPTYVAEIAGINHSHFITAGGSIPFAGRDDGDAGAFWRGFSAIADLTRQFFESVFEGRSLNGLTTGASAGVVVRRVR